MKAEMTRLEIVGMKTNLQEVVRVLHRAGVVHIDDLSQVEDLSARRLSVARELLNAEEEIRFLLTEIHGLLDRLNVDIQIQSAHPVSEASLERLLAQARQGVNELAGTVRELVVRREELQAQMETLPHYRETLRQLVPIIPASAHIPGNVSIGVMTSTKHAHALDLMQRQVMERTAGQAEVMSRKVDDEARIMLFVFHEKYLQAVESLLGQEDVSRLQLPDDLSGRPPDLAMVKIEQRLERIPSEIQAVDYQFEELGREWGERLVAWRDRLADEIEELEVLANLGETDKTFVVAGWVPAQEHETLIELLESEFGETLFIQTHPVTRETREFAPVVLENPSLARPFEALVKLLDLPRYEGIDPTLLMTLFLPFIFGMILGDAGYGLVVLLASLGLMRKFGQGFIRDLLKILAMGAGWSIVFGFLFGEVFGTLGEQLGLHAIWFHRGSGETIPLLLAVTVGVGAAHITLGLLVGVWEAIQEKSRGHLLERGGMLVGLVALFVLTGVLVEYLPQGFMSVSIAGLIVGVALLGASYGWIGFLLGPLEFISLIGNVLSYLRIAAIGLASVFLARVANEVAGLLGSLIVGVIVAVLVHALNIVLGVFSPSIQSLRLHYVEFFQKFYEGGGRPYQPFKSRFSKLESGAKVLVGTTPAGESTADEVG